MHYTRKGHLCRVVFEFIYGSTTTLPTGSGQWLFTLPFPATAALNLDGIFTNIYDSSAAADTFAFGQVSANGAQIGFGVNGQGIRNGYPFTWADGGKIRVAFEYEVK